jgi:hypothetical protein
VAARNKAGTARAIAAFRAHQPLDTTGLLPGIVNLFNSVFSADNENFVRSDDGIFPPDIAAELHPGTRAMVTCGTGDVQVPCATTPALMAALHRAHTTGPGLVVLPDIDHDLHPVGTPINDQILAPAVINALNNFVRPFQTPTH